MGCDSCGMKFNHCPCCGEPLEQEASEPGVTVVIATPVMRDEVRAGARAVKTVGRVGKFKRSMGEDPAGDRGEGLSFHDRVAKRIRRTISGDE